MGTLSVKMKFSALVLASAVSAAPWGVDKDQSPVAISAGSGSAKSGSGSPRSGSPKSGSPKSGSGKHGKSGYGPMTGHGYDKPNQDAMKEEYGEFKDMMAGVNQQNMVNVNFAPINNNNQNFVNVNTQFGMDVDINSKGDYKKDWEKDWDKHDKDEHYDDHDDHHDDHHEIDWNSDKMIWLKKQFMAYFKGEIEAKVEAWKWEMHQKLEPYYPLISELMKNMTGKDCEEWKAYFEETYMDGHKMEDVMMWIKEGHITKYELMEWAKAICDGIAEYKENMTEEEMEAMYNEKLAFLAMFGIEPEKVKAGLEEWMGMSIEELMARITEAEIVPQPMVL